MNDYLDPINSVGMPELTDTAIALEFLLSVKNGVRNYAAALTESPTPEVRTVLLQHLEAAIDLHGEVSELMMNKSWFHPYNMDEQIQLDLKSAQTAVDIAKLPLFPGNTNRKGLFPTPPK
ncbi:spore coat protein [Domibacillus epiphyticus]|uniref:Spore coat protein n=1 Tax=Domibacillus epiphyticus TaxID=1714355 RepID=A0A1V2A544_9BACI|nr:spore coat protein [Domibacillus epiphyticus]OMP66139.1 spore coat protein [Domibacillus epiphyticus]